MAILLFGGTFDPVHHGHLITALRAREELGVARVLLVPAALSPHKLRRVATPGEDRLAMLRLAVQGVAGFEVSDLELHRPPPSYTVDTVETLCGVRSGGGGSCDDLLLLMGADQLPKFHTWHRVADLLALVRVAVLRRPGSPLDLPGLLDASLHRFIAAGRFVPLDTPLIDISGTEVRQRVAAGRPIDFLVPPAVAAYIHQKGLYR